MISAAPTISVVIPHLGQPELLRRCLRSLTDQQDAPPFEVIVVDNGSAEPPQTVCTEFKARFLEEPTPGPGPARNRGVAAAGGAIIAFTDADCRTDPGWLATIARRFQNPKTDVIGGDVRIALTAPPDMTSIEAYESVYGFRTRLYIERDNYVATLNMATRRAVFDAVGPFGGIEIAEDTDWGQRAHAMGYALTYAPDMRVYHPARTSFAELRRKWDRHIGHFYQDARGGGGLWWPRWIAKTGAMALSPAPEILTILRSDRLAGGPQRARALRTLARIRLYRARQMLVLGFGGDPVSMSGAWRGGTAASD